MNFLQEILANTRIEVAARKSRVPVEALRESPFFGTATHSLASALRRHAPAVIAEIKKASPSRGVICSDFDPFRIAQAYEAAGASAISVLTEEKYFQGSLADLESARRAVSLPILRKDFVVDAYQVHEAKAAGADAVLLIAAALAPGEIASLQEEARSLGLECLVEVHSAAELESIRGLDLPLIGINNRDLITFKTDTTLSAVLAPLIPHGAVCVSESGIRSSGDIKRLGRAGIGAFLVGEHCMRSADPGKALAELLRGGGEDR